MNLFHEKQGYIKKLFFKKNLKYSHLKSNKWLFHCFQAQKGKWVTVNPTATKHIGIYYQPDFTVGASLV